MKWVKIIPQGQEQYGVLDGDTIHLTNHTWGDILVW